MLPFHFRLPFACLLVAGAMSFFSGLARAVESDQALPLAYGWNAVCLRVAPVNADGGAKNVEEVFRSTQFSVDQVARLTRAVGSAQFSTDQQTLFNQGGWDLWKATAASGENPSIAVHANSSYLVHVAPLAGQTKADGDPAGTLTIRGAVAFARPDWTKGSYNLVGFGVLGAPTFSALLSASGIALDFASGGAPPVLKLEAGGDWVGVKGSDAVEDGRAYWVNVPYSLAGKGYAGPVAVDFAGAALGTFDFGPGPGTLQIANASQLFTPREITFSSLEPKGGAGHQVTLRRVYPEASSNGADDLRVVALEPVPNQLSWQAKTADLSAGWSAATVAPGASTTVTLGASRNWTSGSSEREQLFRIEVDLGGGAVYYYLPLRGANPDLPPTGTAPPGYQFAGLWLGQVLLDSVTSLAVAGAPKQAASSQAPLRILIHVDAEGHPSLLSHVMLMRTKTASPLVASAPVLVVDETQIPQFEGIQERAGKRVGIRYETASFDMPRDLRAAAQPASVISTIKTQKGYTANSQVTDGDVSNYFSLDTRGSRPPDLPEIYYLSWPLRGQLGAVTSLSTDLPLSLDPYHRSNPFRHAFHPQHGTGYAISRTFQITFDAAQEPGMLTGTYRETTSGLARQPLVSSGRIALRRVSNVPVLH